VNSGARINPTDKGFCGGEWSVWTDWFILRSVYKQVLFDFSMIRMAVLYVLRRNKHCAVHYIWRTKQYFCAGFKLGLS
jgi:hypothetical protein